MLYHRHLLQATVIAGASLIFSAVADAQAGTPLLASGLCNTGLTPKSALPKGCLTSTLVNPINPAGGGPIKDGNWELAQPFPSAGSTQSAPNPCIFTASYTPVPVSAPWSGWYNPSDNLSQWIEPQGGSVGTPPGWYIYRTTFPVPAAESGSSLYKLEVKGQFLSDDYLYAIYVENPAGNEAACRAVATFTSISDFRAWQPFQFSEIVFPATPGYVYFVVFNSPQGNNPTGLRVEFTDRYFFPY